MTFAHALCAGLFILASLYTSAAETSVPTFDFKNSGAGTSWTWDYLKLDQGSEKLFSTERYTVISNDDGIVNIEMSTQFPGAAGFTAHNRIIANIAECRKAYRNHFEKKPWYLAMYNLENGKWLPYEADSTLAFEEKFNCDPYLHDRTDGRTTIIRATPKGDVFEQAPSTGSQSGLSWFQLGGQNAGLTYEKFFASPVANGNPNFVMRLRD